MKTAVCLMMGLALFGGMLRAEERNSSVDFQPPQVISTTEPSYPANTVAGGTVILKVTVDSSGKIEEVRVLQEAKAFTQQAIVTVRKWKFEPAKLNGKPVTASIPVTFSFSQPILWWAPKRK